MTIFGVKTRLVAIFFIFIVGIGLFLRCYNLGKFGFFTDELYHVIGARSILESGSPEFPTGHEYRRAIGVTYLTTLMFRFFGESEAIARLPSVFINLVFLIISFVIVRKWYSSGTALIYLTVMCCSPFDLFLIRQCRMYSHFQLLFFVGAILFFIGFEYGAIRRHQGKLTKPTNSIEGKYEVSLLFLFLAFIVLFASYKFHGLTVNFIIVVISYSILMLTATWYRKGFRKALTSKYSDAIFSIGLAFFFTYIFNKDYLLSQIQVAFNAPSWGTGLNFSKFFIVNFYFKIIRFSFCYILSALFMRSKKRKNRASLYFYAFFRS